MPIYRYKILTADGLQKNGSILADDYKCAYDVLHAKNFQPLEIKKVYFISKKVTLEDILTFFLHISFQLKCGAGINEAIESFADFYENDVLNAALLNISNFLKKGESIGEAFEKCNFIFDNVIIGLLKSAEDTGNTTEIISNIMNFLKLQTDWKNNVKRAIAYPIFITIVALLVLALSIGILGPQIISLLQSNNTEEIPMLTLFTINILPQIFKALFLALAILSFCFCNQAGRDFLFRIVLKIPKIGKLIIKISLWQFCKILHIALDAKLDFMQALDLAIGTIKLNLLKRELENIRCNIINGYKISESFFGGKLISKEILMAIYVGEEGNELVNSFNHISENQYKEILFDIKSLGQILSIGLTISTGLIFVFILCSLFYPIYSYVEVVGV
ncbi:MAG: type II secretion system F family protein [Holosporaceae bacterium]|jgi:type IV pilus assembly protein PilC|nr:type II secretion system F family protein [Holosporaceae bacterium]